MNQQVISYDRNLDIRNGENLPTGTGAKWLEVIEGEDGSYIAKAWRRKLPCKPGIFIQFA